VKQKKDTTLESDMHSFQDYKLGHSYFLINKKANENI